MTSDARFVLKAFDDGSVLFDLESGTLFRLNETAAFIWLRANQGDPPEKIAASLAKSFHLNDSEARRDVDLALSFPETRKLVPAPSSDLRYESRDGHIYRLISDGEPVLEVRAADLHIRTTRPIKTPDLGLFLRILTPKIISLGGTALLHASAVARPDGTVTAFLGRSGAGKTTTARMFVKAGWKPVCEDKLVVRRHQNRLSVSPTIEGLISAWMIDAQAHLKDESNVGRWLDAGPLIHAPTGSLLPLTAFIILAAEQRRGTKMELEPLGPSTSAAEIFQHSFYGSSAQISWCRQIAVVTELAESSRTYRACVPLGLASLQEEARRYVLTTTS